MAQAESIDFYTMDSPDRPDNNPKSGDQSWTFSFPLHDGRNLNVHCGRKVHDLLRAFMLREEMDDAIVEALKDGASEN